MTVSHVYGEDPGNPRPEIALAWLDDGQPRAGSDPNRAIAIGGRREVAKFLVPPPFRRGTPMRVTIDYSGFGTPVVLDWHRVDPNDIGLEDIPTHWVASSAAHTQRGIAALIANINDLAVADAVRAALTDPTVAMRFFRVPGSRAHHHAHPGGLAVHSREVAELATRFLVTGAQEPGYARDLAVAGALLHDIGKCLPGTGYLAHEARGIKLIRDVCERLPDAGSKQHRDLISVLLPRRDPSACESAVRRAISHADQCSAGLSAEQRAFRGRQEAGIAALQTPRGALRYERFADAPT